VSEQWVPGEAIPVQPDRIPRLPLFGWSTFGKRAASSVHCLLDRPDTLLTSSGRVAIALALRELGVGTGDTVLVPTYHCPTMIQPIVRLGATPVFFPIGPGGEPDLDYLERMNMRSVKALIVAHYFGLPRAMDDVRAYCDERGIALIEDCAHALFGGAGGRGVGTTGDYAIGSVVKFLPVTAGGCLVRNVSKPGSSVLEPPSSSDEIHLWVDMLERSARFGRLRGLSTILRALFGAKRLVQRARLWLRGSAKGDTATAAASSSPFDFELRFDAPPRSVGWLLERSDCVRVVAARRRNYLALRERLSSIPGVRPLFPELAADAVPYVFPLWVDNPEPPFRAAWAQGLPVYRWNWSWPTAPRIPGDSGREWADHVFQLPCHQDLSAADMDWLVTTLKRAVAEAS
jgi:perosamine synthetase